MTNAKRRKKSETRSTKSEGMPKLEYQRLDRVRWDSDFVIRTSFGLRHSSFEFRPSLVSVQNPRIFAATALGGVDHERAFAQGDAGEAARQNDGFLAVKHEGAKVYMAALEAALAVRRMARERNHGLSDVVARVGLNLRAELFDFFRGGFRAHQHSVAAGLVGGLHDQLRQMLQDVTQIGSLRSQKRGHVLEDGVLVQVEFNDSGHEIIHHLVVGDAGANRVRETDVSRTIRVDEARNSQGRIAPEGGGVEKIVVNSAVDDMDPLEALGRAHIDARIEHDQIAAFDDLDTHLARQIGVLEVGAVVRAWGQQGDGDVRDTRRGDVAQQLQQFGRVGIHRPHADALEHVGKRVLHGAAVLQDVGNARRTPRIVFEHEVTAMRAANQIGAANVDIDVLGHLEVDELAAEMFGGEDVIGRDDVLFEDALLVVNIVEKQVQGGDALDQAGFDAFPLAARDDARHQVKRKDSFGALRVAINIERDALAQEGEIHRAAFLLELLRADHAEPAVEGAIMFANTVGVANHLIEEIFGAISFEEHGR